MCRIMFSKLKDIMRRSDLLLIVLSLVASALLFSHYGVQGQAAEVELPEVKAAPAPEAEAPSAPQDRVKAGAPVRFLMYNVHDYFVEKDKQRSRFSRRIKRIDEREAVAAVIAKVQPEIVGLVEIGGPAALDDLANRLAAHGLLYPHRKVLTRWGEDRALGILSRHPIVADHSVADCSLVGQTNRRMLRGILDVTVQVADKRQFRILGAHLKSRVSEDPAAAEALRAREARTLAAHVDQALRKQPHIPMLIYGDWNDGPASPALKALTRSNSAATSLRRLTPKDDNGEEWTLYYKDGNEYNTFDQIYVNSVLGKRMGRKSKMGVVTPPDRQRPPSDHRAVWCEIQ